MTAAEVRENIDAIEAAGITRYRIYCNNSYLVEVDSESTRCIFDDSKEIVYCFRIPNMVMPPSTKAEPNEFKSLNFECFTYSVIERFVVATNLKGVTDIASTLGLEITEELTTWLKSAASQTGLYPVQSPGQKHVDSEGKPVAGIDYHGIPTCR